MRFVLISPFEAVCVKERTLRAATYVPSEGEGRFRIVPDEPPAEVPFWPTADPDLPIGGNVWWKYCRPLHVELDPGDVLYLPAMW
jgi:jumonji domain-containing protein 7